MIKIQKNDVEDMIALTPLQEGMLFNYLKETDSSQYFEQLSIGISSSIEFDIFEKAWNFVIDNNEMLRTVFRWDKLNHPVQIILKERFAPVTYLNYEQCPVNQRYELIHEIKMIDCKKKIELDDLTFRITLIKLASDNYHMIISNHHILWDGWSTGIILKEFRNAYISLSLKMQPVSEVKCKFKEFLKYLRKQEIVRCDEYWKKYMKDYELYDNEYITEKKNNYKKQFKKLCRRFSPQLYSDIVETSQRYRVTFAAVFYAAWALVLRKNYSKDDIAFGITVSGRECPIDHVESLVGLLINTLPLRVQINNNETTANFINTIGNMLVNHQEYSSTALKDIMRCNDISGKELFNSVVTIENYPVDELLLEKNDFVSFESLDMYESTDFDLTVTVYLNIELRVELVYNERSFDKNTADFLLDYLNKILYNFTKKENQMIDTLCVSDMNEKNKLQDNFNDDLDDE